MFKVFTTTVAALAALTLAGCTAEAPSKAPTDTNTPAAGQQVSKVTFKVEGMT